MRALTAAAAALLLGVACAANGPHGWCLAVGAGSACSSYRADGTLERQTVGAALSPQFESVVQTLGDVALVAVGRPPTGASASAAAARTPVAGPTVIVVGGEVTQLGSEAPR